MPAALVAAAESDRTGIFNAAGDGVIPVKKAFHAAGTMRIPLPKPLLRLADSGADPDQLVTLVRTVDTLQVLQDLSREASATGDAGLMAAARDRSATDNENFLEFANLQLAELPSMN